MSAEHCYQRADKAARTVDPMILASALDHIARGVGQQGRNEDATVDEEAIANAVAELTAHIAVGLVTLLVAYGVDMVAELLLDMRLPL